MEAMYKIIMEPRLEGLPEFLIVITLPRVIQIHPIIIKIRLTIRKLALKR
jgi:hypothetical protein